MVRIRAERHCADVAWRLTNLQFTKPGSLVNLERPLRHGDEYGGHFVTGHVDGIGKIKRRWLPLQMNSLQVAMMGAVKRELDPQGLLAPGNIL